MDASIDDVVDQAAASILESHLQKKLDLTENQELLDFVNIVFPKVRPRVFDYEDKDPLFIPDEVDVYRIESALLEGGDRVIRRVTEKRAMEEVARQLKSGGVSYVNVILEVQG